MKGRMARWLFARTGGEHGQISTRTMGWISPEPMLTLPAFTCESER